MVRKLARAHATLCVITVLIFGLATARAGDLPRYTSDPSSSIHGAGVGAAKSARDTLVLMGPTGSGAPANGDFEDGALLNETESGWTSIDITQPTANHWQVSDYFAVNGAYSALCGDATLPSCDGGATDPVGGYGNNWDDLLEWRGTVTDVGASTTLTITATANIHSEPGYDATALQVEKAGMGLVDVNVWDGVRPGLAISETATYLPGEYVGGGADEVVVVWHFTSDGGWSDEDCSYPTSGAIQLDDVTVASDNGAGHALVDFEDQTLGPYSQRLSQGVGDFAYLRSFLGDADPCISNFSTQVSFIDDGVVVPGTGSTDCDTHCYGPDGKIVNTTGGLAGPDAHIHNAVHSPVLDWQDPSHRGARLAFTVFRHEDLSADAPGHFYQWHVRSAAQGQDILAQPWQDRSFVYYGSASYLRGDYVVDDLMVPERTQVQIQLAVYELGWIWGWNGHDGYPAPYFDNVRFETYPVVGPGLATREIDLAQDGFPESGTIDPAQPGELWVRFDMAQNISPPSHGRRDFGDSVVFDCVVTRPDAVLDGPPVMHYRVEPNPVFDPYRVGFAAEGAVPCGQVTSPGGVVMSGRWFADLPDTSFLFPGDEVHYYFEATDRDTFTSSVETSILPADTTGYHDFWDPFGYDPSFTLRALPTIADLSGEQPPILFWNDFGDRGGRDEWYTTFRTLAMLRGSDYDVYYTNGPSSGVGNGLGGAATSLQILGYESLLYTSGDLSVNTISNGDLNNDSGQDVQTLTAWLNSGGKGAFLTGDDLAYDLSQSGLETGTLLTDYMNVTVIDRDIRPLIGNQMAPRVLAVNGNPVFATVNSWVAYGGCPGIATFDAVETVGVGQRLAVFADASGSDGMYPYSAATLAPGVGTAGTSEVISLPYAFLSLFTDPREGTKMNATAAARTRVLQDVFSRWGHGFMGYPSDVPAAAEPLSARCEPNPFNPTTVIRYHAPRAGRLVLKVYDVRGARVRTLVDGPVPAGAGQVPWSGKDDRGRGVASGIYFYQARMGDEVRVGKMTLIK